MRPPKLYTVELMRNADNVILMVVSTHWTETEAQMARRAHLHTPRECSLIVGVYDFVEAK